MTSRKGFLLIEIMLALSLLAAGLLVYVRGKVVWTRQISNVQQERRELRQLQQLSHTAMKSPITELQSSEKFVLVKKDEFWDVRIENALWPPLSVFRKQ